MQSLTIQAIRARAVTAPLARPLRTASGSIDVSPLILIDVLTLEGVTGSAYLFAYTPAMLKPLLALIEEIKPDLVGQALVPMARMEQLQRRFRLLGVQGLLGMVISTLDMAYWDALGKAANMPVAQLLGGEAIPIRAYDSYGMVDPVKDRQALEGSLKQGFRAIKIKAGYPELSADVHVVREVRQIIGPDTVLMIDYNQSLQPAEAIRRIRALQEFDLHWVEEPVPAEDLQGHRQVRDATGAAVQTGENWWFPRDAERALSAGACDFMMPDLMKIGGITGWLSVMGLAQSAAMPMSSHIFVEASAHVLAVTPTCHWLEFLDLAAPLLAQPNAVIHGQVTAQGPGLGMIWDEKAVDHYRLK